MHKRTAVVKQLAEEADTENKSVVPLQGVLLLPKAVRVHLSTFIPLSLQRARAVCPVWNEWIETDGEAACEEEFICQ
jgi:hypothetical protein